MSNFGDIERLLDYIREGNIITTFEQEGISIQDDFPEFFASIVERFWNEAFHKDYTEKYYPVFQKDVEEKASQLRNIDLMEFMEKWTGRQFREKKKLIFYPSYLIHPHAHGFDAEEGYVTVYQVQGDAVIGNAIHELLHQLMSGWHKEPGMKGLVDKFRQSRKFRNEWERVGRGYTYPEGWLEEDIVMALSKFLYYRLIGDDSNRPGGFYTDIQRDMFHAIAAEYSPEKYKSFDSFLAEFLAEYDYDS